MLLVGSDDGVYRIDGYDDPDSGSASATRLLGGGRVTRLRQFDGVDGVFAATMEGLYHSTDGREWTALGVPEERVYSVGVSLDGERLFAGTRPAAIYATDWVDAAVADDGEVEWYECEGFQDLPSREEWRLPRHENLAQVRDVTADPGGEERVVAGVEVGGVHLSEDGGETWVERAEGVHDDVHELHVVDAETYVAATGFGLYWTHDAGDSWERLDEDVPQRYFRRAFSIDGEIYAGANMENSSTWDDADADPGAFRVREDGTLEEIPVPTDAGTVTGMTAVDGELVVATHRGHVYVERAGQVLEQARFPTPGDLAGRYTPVTWFAA